MAIGATTEDKPTTGISHRRAVAGTSSEFKAATGTLPTGQNAFDASGNFKKNRDDSMLECGSDTVGEEP